MGFSGAAGLWTLMSHVVGTRGAKGIRHSKDYPNDVLRADSPTKCVCSAPRHCPVSCMVLFRGAFYGFFESKVDGVFDVDERIGRCFARRETLNPAPFRR